MLSCFGRAQLLDTLCALTDGHRRIVTRAVLEEVRAGLGEYPALGDVPLTNWLEEVRSDSLTELRAFSEYVRILGAGRRDVGEASILAWAEANGGVAVIDDQAGVDAAKRRGVTVRRTLTVISNGVVTGLLTGAGAAQIIDDLRIGGARFPCDGASFVAWAKKNGLL